MATVNFYNRQSMYEDLNFEVRNDYYCCAVAVSERSVLGNSSNDHRPGTYSHVDLFKHST